MKKVKILSLVLAGIMMLGNSICVMAASTPDYENEGKVEIVSTSIDTAMYGNPGENNIQPRSSSYNVSSYVDKKTTYENGEKVYYSDGWVSLIDKTTGAGVRHYSNAAMEDRSGWYIIVYAESGRKWGVGTVSATSSTTIMNVGAYIYYGTEE